MSLSIKWGSNAGRNEQQQQILNELNRRFDAGEKFAENQIAILGELNKRFNATQKQPTTGEAVVERLRPAESLREGADIISLPTLGEAALNVLAFPGKVVGALLPDPEARPESFTQALKRGRAVQETGAGKAITDLVTDKSLFVKAGIIEPETQRAITGFVVDVLGDPLVFTPPLLKGLKNAKKLTKFVKLLKGGKTEEAAQVVNEVKALPPPRIPAEGVPVERIKATGGALPPGARFRVSPEGTTVPVGQGERALNQLTRLERQAEAARGSRQVLQTEPQALPPGRTTAQFEVSPTGEALSAEQVSAIAELGGRGRRLKALPPGRGETIARPGFETGAETLPPPFLRTAEDIVEAQRGVRPQQAARELGGDVLTPKQVKQAKARLTRLKKSGKLPSKTGEEYARGLLKAAKEDIIAKTAKENIDVAKLPDVKGKRTIAVSKPKEKPLETLTAKVKAGEASGKEIKQFVKESEPAVVEKAEKTLRKEFKEATTPEEKVTIANGIDVLTQAAGKKEKFPRKSVAQKAGEKEFVKTEAKAGRKVGKLTRQQKKEKLAEKVERGELEGDLFAESAKQRQTSLLEGAPTGVAFDKGSLTKAGAKPKPIERLGKPKAAKPKTTPIEKLTEPKQTFRQFVESKGVKWESVSGKNKDKALHQKLFDEFHGETTAKETVTFRGLQQIPGTNKAVTLVDLPNGSTVGLDETVHALSKAEKAKLDEAIKASKYESVVGEKEAIQIMEGEPIATKAVVSGRDFAEGLLKSVQRDIFGETLGIVADPLKHTRDFVSKNALKLTDDEIEKLTNFTRKVAQAEGVTADDQIRLINEFIGKNIKSPVEQVTSAGQFEGFPIPPKESFGQSKFKEFTDDAREIIGKVAVENEGGIKAARRGVLSNDELLVMAEKRMGNVERKILNDTYKPQFASEEEDLAARLLLADKIDSVVDDVLAGKPSKLVEAVFGGKAAAGRKLQAQKIPINLSKERLEKMRQLLKDTPEGPMRDRLNDVLKATGLSKGEINPTALDKFVEWATMIKLTGLSTQARNVTGNAAMVAFRLPEKLAAGGIDAAKAAIKGTDRSVFAQEAAAEVIGGYKSFKNAVHRALTVMHDPTKYFEEITKAGEVMIKHGAIGRGGRAGKALDELIRPRSRKFIEALPEGVSKRVFPAGEFGFNFGEIVRSPGRLLSGMDVFFKEINTGAEIYALATRKALQEGLKGERLMNRIAHFIQNPTDEMVKLAKESAIERVFQEEITGVAKRLDDIRRKHPVTRLFVPFFKTPVNILKQSIQRTPLTVALPSTWKTIRGTDSAAKAALVSRAFSGSLFLSALGMYASEGEISGRGTDSKARRNMMRLSGWQPYSVKVGNQWLSYSGFEPLSSWLRTAADIAEGTKKGANAESIAASATTSYVKQFAENPFLMGVKDIVNAFDSPSNRIPKLIGGLVTGSTLPVILQQWGTRVWDPVVREPRNFWQQIQGRLPFGISKGVSAMRNVFGDEIVRENPVLQSLGLTISYEKTSKMGREMGRLSRLDPGLVIGKPSRIINGFELTDDEYDRFLVLKGAMFKKQLSQLMNYGGYDNFTDDMKIKIIRRLSSQMNEFTRSTEFAKYYTNRSIQ
jgi:hypothetical protein